jgi:hypothetical protein
MAKAAAAYVHPRLNSTEIGGKDGNPVIIEITPDQAKCSHGPSVANDSGATLAASKPDTGFWN